MRTYTSARNFDLSFSRNNTPFNLYLEVGYQVDDSQVTVRSIRSSGHNIISELSNDDVQAIAQQIEDKVQDVDGGY